MCVESSRIRMGLSVQRRQEIYLRQWATGHTSEDAELTNEDDARFFFFFDVHGIVHHEFVPPHQTVMSKFYLEVLVRLRARITWVHIMTMHRHIHHSQYADIWRIKYSHITTPALQPRPRPLQLFSVRQIQVGAERDTIRLSRRN